MDILSIRKISLDIFLCVASFRSNNNFLNSCRLPKSTKFFVHKNLILSIGIIDFLVGIFSQKDVNAELRKKQVC